MKKVLVLLLMTIFIYGCGSPEGSSRFKGKVEKKDYIAQGMKYLSRSDIQRAIASFDEAIRQDPTNVQNYITLGQVYMRLKNFNRAVDSLTAATKIDPNSGEAFYLLAASRSLSGDKEKAIKDAQRSSDIFYKTREEEKFKRSVALLKGLMESDQVQVESQR